MNEHDMRTFVNEARVEGLNTPQIVAMRDDLGAAIAADMGPMNIDGIKGAITAMIVLMASFDEPADAPTTVQIMTVLVAGHLADLWDMREAGS